MNNKTNYSKKYLENIILDMADGIYNVEDFKDKFGFSAVSVREVWNVIVDLRNQNNDN